MHSPSPIIVQQLFISCSQQGSTIITNCFSNRFDASRPPPSTPNQSSNKNGTVKRQLDNIEGKFFALFIFASKVS